MLSAHNSMKGNSKSGNLFYFKQILPKKRLHIFPIFMVGFLAVFVIFGQGQGDGRRNEHLWRLVSTLLPHPTRKYYLEYLDVGGFNVLPQHWNHQL